MPLEALRSAFESVAGGAYALDTEWRFIAFNTASERFTGRTRAEVLGRDFFGVFPLAKGTLFEERARIVMAGAPAETFEAASNAHPGCMLEIRLAPLAAGGLAVTFTDITERTRMRNSERQHARLLEMIARGCPLDDCLAAVTAAVAALQPGLRALLMLADESRASISRVISPDVPEAFGLGVRNAPITAQSTGSCAEAIVRRAPVTCPDIAGDLRRSESWRALCLSCGIAACHSEPVFAPDGECRASLMLCLDEAREPDPWELQIARSFAPIAGIAIEHARSREKLRDSEARLRAAILASPFPIMMHAEDGEVLELSRKWTGLSGYAREEIRTHFDWCRLAYPDQAEAIAAAIASEFEAGGENAGGECAIRCRDGSRRVWDFYNVGLGRLPDGRRVQICAGADVTERRRTEDALKAAAARLRLAQKVANIGVWDWDLAADTVEGSPELYEILGIDPNAAPAGLASAWRPAMHPEDRPRAEAALRRAARGGTGFTMDWRVMRGGEWRWVRVQGAVIGDREEGSRRVVGVALDVTEEHRHAEGLAAEVEARRRELDHIWRASRDAFTIVDFAGLYRNVSPAFGRILGWEPGEVTGRPILDFVHPDDLAATRAEMERLVRGQSLFQFENRVRHRDGSYRRIAWTAAPEDALIYAVGRDVTAERETRAALEAAQAQVHEMQKLETIGQLTGGVAHDFNNLLTPIVGVLDMLRRRHEDERTQRMIGGAMQAAERARTLVQRLLAFARRQHLEARPVDIAALLEGMADLMTRSLGPSIRLKMEIAEALPPARVDPAQLELAILNLAVNARDAMPEGGELTIRAEAVAGRAGLAPGRYVSIAVSDTGCGMDEETLRRAVEPFFTTKGLGRGTGLGLSMVHGLAAQSGGDFSLASRPGQGVTATIWLPVSDRPAEAGRPEAEAPVIPIRARARIILLVDDEDLVRRGTAAMLEEVGYTVIEASSGAEAQELARSGCAFDALVTDYAMPGITGTQLARALRKLRPALPVLLITGYASLTDHESDALPRLAKPYRQNDLAIQVNELIDQTPAQRIDQAG